MVIAAPGIYPDRSEADYHGDVGLAGGLGPHSLSASGIRELLRCPAVFAYRRANPPPSTEVFDLGRAAHAVILGAGAALEVVDAPDWRRAEHRAARDAARADGRIPVLAADMARVDAMADAVMNHATARDIFHPGLHGEPEVSVYWLDRDTGVTCRARVDWVHPVALVDLKTTANAGDGFPKSAANFGYYQQAEWYARGWEAVTGERREFAIVAVEKEPPHAVACWWLTDTADLEAARAANDAALVMFADCEARDEWPGYPDQVLRLPAWAHR